MSKKIEYSYIKNFIESEGYILLSEKYEGNEIKLLFKDKEEYIYDASFNSFRYKNILFKFHPSNRYTLQNISNWLRINNKNFILISDTYVNNASLLEFKCKKDNCQQTFFTCWNNILHDNGCPYCKGKKIAETNSLFFLRPDLAKEWNYIKNKNLLPMMVSVFSNKRVWWMCDKGHEWNSIINSRSSGSNCPQCNKSKGEEKIAQFLLRAKIQFEIQKKYKDLRGNLKGFLSYDFYIPCYNLLIEYQGIQHERPIDFFKKNENNPEKIFQIQQEHDSRKRTYAIQNNIQLLEIWYYDFNRIEEILLESLNL